MNELNKKALEFASKFENLQNEATQFFKGRKIRVISEYNGQVYGCSKKAMTGKVMTIRYVSLENGLSFGCEEERPYIYLDEVEFI